MTAEIHNRHGEKIDYAFHEGANAGKVVILGHGVTGDKDREFMVELAQKLADHGWSTMRITFAGNGQSGGCFRDVTITKQSEDLSAVIDQVKNAKKLAYIGYSMGGAVGALTAGRDDRINVLVSLAGMVNTKTFCDTEFGEETPDQGVMWEHPEHPLTQKFVDDLSQINTTLPAVENIRLPWLLIHGQKDDVVLPVDSEQLFEKLKGPKHLVSLDEADHSFEGHWDALVTEISAWFDKHL